MSSPGSVRTAPTLRLMSHGSPFLVHVGDLLRDTKRTRPLRLVESVDWAVELSRVLPEPPLEVNVTLRGASGGVVVRGTAEAVVEHTCPRCLETRDVVVVVEIDQIAERDGGDDGYELMGEQLDLEPIVRDEVLLALPIRPLCEPPCSGLVRDTQTDLNVATPGPPGRSDSPFAVLQDLFDPGD